MATLSHRLLKTVAKRRHLGCVFYSLTCPLRFGPSGSVSERGDDSILPTSYICPFYSIINNKKCVKHPENHVKSADCTKISTMVCYFQENIGIFGSVRLIQRHSIVTDKEKE